MDLLLSLPKKEGKNTIFDQKSKNARSSAFHNRMIRLAKIHGNPRFKEIHLHTLRHCKALRVYHKSHEILEVMEVLGHRKIETTYRYIRLYRQVYKNRQPKIFETKIAKTDEEAIWYWNNGWTLVDTKKDKRFFRKAKEC
jgi:integrase